MLVEIVIGLGGLLIDQVARLLKSGEGLDLRGIVGGGEVLGVGAVCVAEGDDGAAHAVGGAIEIGDDGCARRGEIRRT